MKRMENKAVAAIIATVTFFIIWVLISATIAQKNNVEISKREFHKAEKKAEHQYDDVATAILTDADILYSIVPEDEKPFIKSIKEQEFELYFKQPVLAEDDRYCRVIIDVGLLDECSAENFLEFFGKQDSFEEGYMTSKVMEYNILDEEILPRLVVSPNILAKEEENYDIMASRPHVEFDCPLVDAVREAIPFETTDGECFFTIDEYTRLCGWFYFKSNYNGEEFIGCYKLKDWPTDISYHDVVNLKSLHIEEVGDYVIKIRSDE